MSQSAAQFQKDRSRPLIPWMILFITVFSSVVAWRVIEQLSAERDNRRFDEIRADLQNSIVETVDSQMRLGKSVAAFMGSNKDATEAEFDDFLNRQNWPDPGSKIGAIGFMRRVLPGGGPAFIEEAHRRGVLNMKLDPSREGLDREVDLFRLPKNPLPPGLDLITIPDRRDAMMRAADTASPAATTPLILRQDAKTDRRQDSEAIFLPVYSSAVAPPPGPARRKAIKGFVGVGIRVGNLIGEHLKSQPQRPYVDLSILSDAGKRTSLFSNLPNGWNPNLVQTESINLYGRTWIFTYFSSPEFDAASSGYLSPLILGSGVLFGLILFVLTNSQVRSQAALAEYAHEIEKRASAESLLAKAGALFSGSDDHRSILDQIGRACVPSLADFCAIHLLDGERIDQIGFYRGLRKIGEPPAVYLDDVFGIGRVLVTGKSNLEESLSAHLGSNDQRDSKVREYLDAGFASAMFVPILVRGRTFGSISFLNGPTKPPYSATDLRQVEEVAERIGLAVDNATLYKAVQKELSEKIKAELALTQLNEELEILVEGRTRELSIAVEELEAFCYSVSHDLRAPLRSVDGFSKALIEDYGTQIDSEGVDFLNRIRASARRMDELITAMLTLSRLTRAEISPTTVDLSEMALSIMEELPVAKTANYSVSRGLSAKADPNMLRILLDNLISNAAKFSSKQANPKIEVGKAENGAFFVRDNGTGFDPRFSNKLFQPFERLHSPQEYPGTGIGLATVSRVVKRHGGKIWAESEPGSGATFYFTLGD